LGIHQRGRHRNRFAIRIHEQPIDQEERNEDRRSRIRKIPLTGGKKKSIESKEPEIGNGK